MTCRHEGCPNEVAAPGLSRCEDHQLRWSPGKPAEKPIVQESTWVRRAREGRLPGKALTA